MKLDEKLAVFALIEGRLKALDQLDNEYCPEEAINWMLDRYLRMRREIGQEIKAELKEKLENGEFEEITGGFVS